MSEVTQDKGAESATAPTSEQDLIAKRADLESRLAGFNVELGALCAKYELKLYAEPRIDLKTGRVVADPKVLDARTDTKAGDAVA